MARRLVAAAALAALVPAAGGCGTNDSDGEGPRRLTVLAAASLAEPFGELARRFEAGHEGVSVVTGFDSSATIAAQVVAGAPADVVATADHRTMATMAEAGVLAGRPATFARNELALVVPPDDPAGIDDVGDLDRADYAVCAPAVPCGALAAQLLSAAGVTRDPVTFAVDVKAVLTKVMLGSVDAGIVYASDVVAAGPRVREVPLDRPPSTEYPIALVAGGEEASLAREFVDLVLSAEGRQVLAEAGFQAGAGR